MPPISHSGRQLKHEPDARVGKAAGLGPDLDVPPGRVTDTLDGRSLITAGTAEHLGPHLGNIATL